MSKMTTHSLGMGAALLIVVMSFGVFAGTAALITRNQSGLVSITLAEDGEDGGGDNEDNGDDNEDSGDDNEDTNDDKEAEKAKKEAEREREATKKQAEREREAAKKQAEREREAAKKQSEMKKESEKSGFAMEDDDSDDNEIEDMEENDEADENEDHGDDEGMYKDRDKTLEKLQEKIAEAEKKILEKQGEGIDVTAALARLAAAKSGVDQVGSLFDAADLDAAKLLAKQIKKIAHFTEKDIEFSKKLAEELTKVEKRFGQVEKKIALLRSLGGDASAFQAELASLRSDFSALKGTAATPGTVTRETIKAFEKQVKRLKSLVESAVFAYGGDDDDDDLARDHEEESDDLFEDLDDVAEIEDGDDKGVSGKVRRIAAEHKTQAETVKQSLEDIKDRDGLTRTLFGPDFNALDTLSEQIAAIQARAVALSSLAGQMSDPDIRQILLDQADALESEALKLQSYAAAENEHFSIFGAFLKLFR